MVEKMVHGNTDDAAGTIPAGRNTIEFYGEMVNETPGAYLVFDGINNIWVPRSLVKSLRRIGSPSSPDFEFVVPVWFARKNGIV